MTRSRPAAGAVLMTALTVSAIRPAARSQPPQPPVFRSAADIVEVDVTVQDRSGRFIDDLTAADFELREEGALQNIELLYLVGGGTAARSASEASSVAENAAPRAGPRQRVFVVVFDDASLSAGGLRRLQAAASVLFTNEFHPGDLGGVVVDGNLIGSRLLSDRDELLRAVARAHPRIATASDLESST